jgi:hypothetical protein
MCARIESIFHPDYCKKDLIEYCIFSFNILEDGAMTWPALLDIVTTLFILILVAFMVCCRLPSYVLNTD